MNGSGGTNGSKRTAGSVASVASVASVSVAGASNNGAGIHNNGTTLGNASHGVSANDTQVRWTRHSRQNSVTQWLAKNFRVK